MLLGRDRGLQPRSAFAGFRFPAEVIVVAVRWYGLQTDRTAQVVIAGYVVPQNVCRGHSELAVEARPEFLP
jgi:hypothetical protein